MDIKVQRYSSGETSTLSRLYINDVFFCYVCEDDKDEVKVAGETRIPALTSTVKFYKVVTPKTTQYRNKFSWFTWHLEIQNVPNYKNVYIHIGNTAKDSEGCLLLGNTVYPDPKGGGTVGNSTAAFTLFYQKVSKALNAGEVVNITILDEEST